MAESSALHPSHTPRRPPRAHADTEARDTRRGRSRRPREHTPQHGCPRHTARPQCARMHGRTRRSAACGRALNSVSAKPLNTLHGANTLKPQERPRLQKAREGGGTVRGGAGGGQAQAADHPPRQQAHVPSRQRPRGAWSPSPSCKSLGSDQVQQQQNQQQNKASRSRSLSLEPQRPPWGPWQGGGATLWTAAAGPHAQAHRRGPGSVSTASHASHAPVQRADTISGPNTRLGKTEMMNQETWNPKLVKSKSQPIKNSHLPLPRKPRE